MKNLLKAVALSLALLTAAPGFAQRIRITLAPPLLQSEVIPERPNATVVWQHGYYMYDPASENYTYVAGRWVMPPYEGATWVAPSYRFQNGEYLFVPGRWRARETEHEKEHD